MIKVEVILMVGALVKGWMAHYKESWYFYLSN
jgi:hypothetical protein